MSIHQSATLSASTSRFLLRIPPSSFQLHPSLLLLLLFVSIGQLSAQETRQMVVRQTPDKVPYGLIGDVENRKAPAPTLVVFAHSIETMQKQTVYTEACAILAKQGWVSVIIEPPCHGADIRPGEPEQLNGWRHRVDNGEDLIGPFAKRASAVLDLLIEQKIADPTRVAAFGTSRGGFLAYHFAAIDPRIKATSAVSPVTRLTALREFTTMNHRENAEKLDVAKLGSALAGKAVWLSIGNNDARVNTDDAIEFTRSVVRATARPDTPDAQIPVELIVGPAKGHSKIDQAHELLAVWLVAQLSPPDKK